MFHGFAQGGPVCEYAALSEPPCVPSDSMEHWRIKMRLTWDLCHSPPSSCPPEWKEADEPDPSDEEIWQALYQEAPELISLATNYGLRILALQPLNQFDGWPEGSVRAEWVRRKAERWLPLCSKLEVELLQVIYILH